MQPLDITNRFPADAATRKLIAQGDTRATLRAWERLTRELNAPSKEYVVVAQWKRPRRGLFGRPAWSSVLIPGAEGLPGLLHRYLGSRCTSLEFVVVPVALAPDHPSNYDALFR